VAMFPGQVEMYWLMRGSLVRFAALRYDIAQ
jgi:hypothetical protein